MAASVLTSHVFEPAKLISNAGGVGPAKFNIRTDPFTQYMHIYIYIYTSIYVYIYIYMYICMIRYSVGPPPPQGRGAPRPPCGVVWWVGDVVGCISDGVDAWWDCLWHPGGMRASRCERSVLLIFVRCWQHPQYRSNTNTLPLNLRIP